MIFNSNIKSMKLYNHVNRIFNELRELGKNNSEPLLVEELSKFDQLHYYGTEAVDFAIKKIGIKSPMSILEIGSGIGGPARYIASKTGATITALELQPDQNKLALDLTKRCGLSEKVIHVCGDFLSYDWHGQKFDVIVSWLTFYHIFEFNILLQNCFDLLNKKGSFYVEDLISRKPFTDDEFLELSKEIYANNLSNYQDYKLNLKKVGFKLISCQDMSEQWTKFTRERILTYNQNKNRNLRVHGKNVVSSLSSFYSFIDRYFASGKLGGIRIIAYKNFKL
jgi:cyclopropane fatty-acyl-phospholipid synthase-like methyltransferase